MKAEHDERENKLRYFHAVPIKNISVSAQAFNVRKVVDEFWEDFEYVSYISPIAYASCVNDARVFMKVLGIFHVLDSRNMKYSSSNTAADFVKKHIVTDGAGQVHLCNKHLIRSIAKKGKMSQQYYSRPCWIRDTLKIVFPKIEATKEGIPTNTPQWAISLYAANRGDSRPKK